MSVEADRFEFAGVTVDGLDADALLALIDESISAADQRLIAHHNLHSIYLSRVDPLMSEYYEQAAHTIADGIGPVLLGRLYKQRLSTMNRITCVDYIPKVFADASRRGWKLFYLGARPEVLERGMDRVRRRWPDIKIAGHHGFFDMAEGSTQNGAVIGAINAAACDVLLVGMGMPRQEHWIAANRSAINAKVILATGGFMDYFAGEIPTPPRLLARVGLEWLFRLRDEPRRLWKRYLVEPWLLMHIIVMDAIRRRGKKA